MCDTLGTNGTLSLMVQQSSAGVGTLGAAAGADAAAGAGAGDPAGAGTELDEGARLDVG